jgi:hypothetical protein
MASPVKGRPETTAEFFRNLLSVHGRRRLCLDFELLDVRLFRGELSSIVRREEPISI